jgi:hypothetical protein
MSSVDYSPKHFRFGEVCPESDHIGVVYGQDTYTPIARIGRGVGDECIVELIPRATTCLPLDAYTEVCRHIDFTLGDLPGTGNIAMALGGRVDWYLSLHSRVGSTRNWYGRVHWTWG